MPALEKDSSVLDLISKLELTFGAQAFSVIDDWDADLMAIGIGGPSGSRPLVYVSTHLRPGGRYYADIELPSAAGSEQPYAQGPRFDDVDFAELVGIVSRTLGIAPKESN